MGKEVKKTSEPFWWALFGAGGALSALFLPVIAAMFFLAVPLGILDELGHSKLYGIIAMPIVRLFLLALIMLSLFHWAHRFRFTLYDGLQVKHLNELIAILTYGSAIIGTLVAGYFLFTF